MPGSGALTKKNIDTSGTRQRILDAAARILVEKGYSGTRLSDIAVYAAIQTPAIYYYFSSREELLEKVIETGHRKIFDHLSQVVEEFRSKQSVTGMELIMAATGAHIEILLSHSDYASVSARNYNQLPDGMRARLVPGRARIGGIWREIFNIAERQGELSANIDPSVARMMVLGAISWATEWWKPGGDASIEDVKQTAQAMIRAGLVDS